MRNEQNFWKKKNVQMEKKMTISASLLFKIRSSNERRRMQRETLLMSCYSFHRREPPHRRWISRRYYAASCLLSPSAAGLWGVGQGSNWPQQQPQKLITAVVIRRNMGQSIVFMFWLDAESSQILEVQAEMELRRKKKERNQGPSITEGKKKTLITAPYCL